MPLLLGEAAGERARLDPVAASAFGAGAAAGGGAGCGRRRGFGRLPAPAPAPAFGGAAASAGAGGRRRRPTASSPSPAISAITVPTFTSSVPSATRIFAIVPSSTASNSIVALSVSISASMSPARPVALLDQPFGERPFLHGRARERASSVRSAWSAASCRDRAAPSKQQRRGRVKPVLSDVRRQGRALARTADLAQHPGEDGGAMRSYLVVMDETEEARAALALRGAAGGADRRRRRDPRAHPASRNSSSGAASRRRWRRKRGCAPRRWCSRPRARSSRRPGSSRRSLVRQGDPVKAVAELLEERDDIAALVLGAAAEGGPGPAGQPFLRRGRRAACPAR